MNGCMEPGSYTRFGAARGDAYGIMEGHREKPAGRCARHTCAPLSTLEVVSKIIKILQMHR